MQAQHRDLGPQRFVHDVPTTADAAPTARGAGFAVVGSRAHLPPDLEHRVTRVTPRAFEAWCDGSLRVVVFGDDAFRVLDPGPIKACLAAHGMVAILCPVDSGWSEFSLWARAEVGDVVVPAELPAAIRAVLGAATTDA